MTNSMAFISISPFIQGYQEYALSHWYPSSRHRAMGILLIFEGIELLLTLLSHFNPLWDKPFRFWKNPSMEDPQSFVDNLLDRGSFYLPSNCPWPLGHSRTMKIDLWYTFSSYLHGRRSACIWCHRARKEFDLDVLRHSELSPL